MVTTCRLAMKRPDHWPTRRVVCMFLAFNTSVRHQFEFVQQQWINYGDEFRQGDDTDPIVEYGMAMAAW